MKAIMRIALVSLLAVSTVAYAGGGKGKKGQTCPKQNCPKECPKTPSCCSKKC